MQWKKGDQNMDSNLISAIAEVVSYCAPMVAIFGFISWAFKAIYNAFSGGRLK